MTLEQTHQELLREIYYKTEQNRFISLDELETLVGQPGARLRPALEDLKNLGYIVENDLFFELSNAGRSFVRSYWA